MLRKIPWKTVLIFSGAISIILFILYVFISGGEVNLQGKRYEKTLELNNTRIVGWKNGQKYWEFFAKNAWTDVNQTFTELDEVYKGVIFKNQKVVVKNIKAWLIREYKYRDEIDATGKSSLEGAPVSQQLEADINLKEVVKQDQHGKLTSSKSEGFTRIWADRLNHFRKEGKTIATGNIKIQEKNRILFAKRMEIDHNRDTAYITENPTLKTSQMIIGGENLETPYGEETVVIKKNVNIFIYPKKNKGGFQITCEHVEYFKKEENARMLGNLKILQKDKVILGNEAFYHKRNQTLNVSGDVCATLHVEKETQIKCLELLAYLEKKDFNAVGQVEVLQPGKTVLAPSAKFIGTDQKIKLENGVQTILEKGKVLIKEETLKRLDAPEEQEALEEKTVMSSNLLSISTQSGDILATGSVEVTQKGRKGKSEIAVYDDQSEIITMTKNVYIDKKGDWIKTNKIIISVSQEAFEAFGEVESKFKLKH